jgi:hypothetical protein
MVVGFVLSVDVVVVVVVPVVVVLGRRAVTPSVVVVPFVVVPFRAHVAFAAV